MAGLGFYGNEELKTTLGKISASGKVPHSIVITGQKGMGKRTASKYIGASFLCENSQNGIPCGKCKSCNMIAHGGHPDFIEVKPSGKNGIYKLEEDLRPIISDACIKPNESRYKIVVIADMDNTQASNQNVLLKLVEEPPMHLIIIMTACAREYFLPTILSRVSSFKVTELSQRDLLLAVKENCNSFDEMKFKKGYEALGGNCGKVIEFIDGKELSLAVEITEDVCKNVISKDEYGLMTAFVKADGDKKLFVEVLELFSKVLRDCVVAKNSTDEPLLMGCCKGLVPELCARLSTKKAMDIFSLCEKYISRIMANGNPGLCIASVCAEIMEIL